MNFELKNILQKTRELYFRYGIKSITMDDVARELAISKKTLYQFVADKDDLVGKFIDFEIDLRQNQINECFKIGFNAIEELFEISDFMTRMMRDQNPVTEHDLRKYYPHHFQRIVSVRRERMYNYILQNLRKGKDEGLYREELDEEIIAKLFISRSEDENFRKFFSAEEFSSSRLFLEILMHYIRGIATKKGINVLEKKIEEIDSKKLNN
jgi:TetR/AcrR family transcriptional regulator, cholesterol catabolism regulator